MKYFNKRYFIGWAVPIFAINFFMDFMMLLMGYGGCILAGRCKLLTPESFLYMWVLPSVLYNLIYPLWFFTKGKGKTDMWTDLALPVGGTLLAWWFIVALQAMPCCGQVV